MHVKKYLRFGNPIVIPTADRFVGEVRNALEWVDKLEDGTADYREAAEATQQRLADEFNLETTLVEIQDTHQLQSKWVICKTE
jgi:hypothetical protein